MTKGMSLSDQETPKTARLHSINYRGQGDRKRSPLPVKVNPEDGNIWGLHPSGGKAAESPPLLPFPPKDGEPTFAQS